MRADLACESGDHKLALRLYRKVMEQSAELIPEVLPRLAACAQAGGAEGAVSRALEALIKRDPGARQHIAEAAILNETIDNEVASACVREFIRSNATLMALFESVGFSSPDLEDEEVLGKLRAALHRLAAHGARYRCGECGFASATLYWQCPTCKSWETLRPAFQLSHEQLLHPRDSSLRTG